MKWLIRNFIQRARRFIPQRLKFGYNLSQLILDHIDPYIYIDKWWVQPLNGQVKRLQQISLIADAYKATHMIETGTYLGSSTIYLSKMVTQKTYTIEIDDKTARKARKRFESNHSELDVELIVGDSSLEIVKVLERIPTTNKVLAYLDAHWLAAIPTKSELNALNNWGENWIAIIDDFKIEDDLGYGFDSYGNIEIGINIVPIIEGMQVWIPNFPSSCETGARRGTGYVFTKKSIQDITNDSFKYLKRIR